MRKETERAQGFRSCYREGGYISTVNASATMVSGMRRVGFIPSPAVSYLATLHHPAIHCYKTNNHTY